ncbi:MAG: MBL fold metallo-hydrolase [Candidatus Eremiobacteraeota bacterium]|nr:MBL fold metallo-hydrolase [Candidatus Eremiobacteraeota bacterium]MBV8354568.1 MBL fold metallo-hydrolase [Candidatus Eremiobacteraeota bacterium]
MVRRLTARVVRVRAANPSPMTLTGTNTYVIDVGDRHAVVIDPGPRLEAHVDAIVAALAETRLTLAAILVTHGHPDHAPAAELLAARTGAPVWAHARARFPHDRELADREQLAFDTVTLDVVDAPGHALDHLVFWLSDEKALFTGDVVLGEGTTVIAPPGGAMRPYQQTLRRLEREYVEAEAIHGGHGEPVGDPRERLRYYISHREGRERQVLQHLERGAATIPALVETIYARHDRRLWPAAARQVLAHLLALEEENRVVPHVLERPSTPTEREILEPDLRRIADPSTREVAREELGTTLELPLVEYRLA